MHTHIVCKSHAVKRLVLFHIISIALHGLGVSPAAARQSAKQGGRAADSSPTTVEHVHVKHGRANVLVAQLSYAASTQFGFQHRSHSEPRIRVPCDRPDVTDRAAASLTRKVAHGQRSRGLLEE
jgi:hypothetical protein